jgi:NitT/TauT family transport system substrate-binding protein
MYDPTGIMPTTGPKTVLSVLGSFNSDISASKIDLSKTYTDDFVKAVPTNY